MLAEPSLARYTGWARAGDEGWVAQGADGAPVGGARWLFFTTEDSGYGFVDSHIPELLPESQSAGLPGHPYRCNAVPNEPEPCGYGVRQSA